MAPIPDETVLITGASAGLGKNMTRQLALRGDFGKISLGCRNQARAQAAKRELENTTGTSRFEIVLMDVSDPRSVRSAIAFHRPSAERPGHERWR